MATPERRSVQVWAAFRAGQDPALLGLLHATRARGKEVFSFEYDQAWLESGEVQILDPSLRHYRGPQYLAESRDNFGAFLDSSPDRWGRVLMRRREAQLAREQQRPERKLFEVDYLLGVYDGHRMGALRYSVDDGPFLDDNAELASPPWTSLQELEQASLHLEREGAEQDPSYAKWLRLLIAPGRSLGGARPKASVVDPNQGLWIAKFPSREDVEDVGAWEAVAHALAKRAGIQTADAQLQRFGSRHHTFLTRRFDRRSDGSRRHFASAMTMLERKDGDEGASYLDLAEVLIRQGARPEQDLEQLWRRIVFSMSVSNVDDHLRNHGFLLEDGGGWTLSPAYDMNPVAHGEGLHLNVSETDNAQDFDLARDVAKYFRLSPKRANAVLDEVVVAVRDWREEAERVGLGRTAQERMATAFRLVR